MPLRRWTSQSRVLPFRCTPSLRMLCATQHLQKPDLHLLDRKAARDGVRSREGALEHHCSRPRFPLCLLKPYGRWFAFEGRSRVQWRRSVSKLPAEAQIWKKLWKIQMRCRECCGLLGSHRSILCGGSGLLDLVIWEK